jgi:hypothetical protein
MLPDFDHSVFEMILDSQIGQSKIQLEPVSQFPVKKKGKEIKIMIDFLLKIRIVLYVNFLL